ncbi:MAG: hypothetical protein P0Y65_01955 [Candidatus Devosia phytovorans]|uniref:Uncharacterized protein n=1 Tax=Candidatus Devosia phytovorans TaxID=3121372 RepID=A0AAJ5VW75_9HYPH|nr:hypothetical protein [Devosia sp.]WEK05040.1 MAG: hypothetical protein P0Y65_01955 [Devosia sp.]
MNKIVREHYPVENLPEDLRLQFRGVDSVTVVSEASAELDERGPLPHADAIALMRQMQRENEAKGKTVSTEEAVARIRALRDEWDD